MPPERDAIVRSVERYYSARLEAHGATPQGVDWRDAASQELRFEQLLRVAEGRTAFSLIDYGCGYGALLEYLRARGAAARYTGFDVSEEMLRHARERFDDDPDARFVGSETDIGSADFTVASGIFNVRLDVSDDVWLAYTLETIHRMAAASSSGIAFNMLTSYSDPPLMRPDLYYADPRFFFDHCKRNLSRNIALLHDYDLYEFTIIVRT